jgi:hypothetical protein
VTVVARTLDNGLNVRHAECPRRSHQLGAKDVSGIHFVSFFFEGAEPDFDSLPLEVFALLDDLASELALDFESDDFDSEDFDSPDLDSLAPPPLPDSADLGEESDFSDEPPSLFTGADVLRSFFPSLP